MKSNRVKMLGGHRTKMKVCVVGGGVIVFSLLLLLMLLFQLLTFNEFISQGSTQVGKKDVLSLSLQQYILQQPVPNRTLAIIMGSFRGGESSWQTMASNVLDPSSADLAILIPEDDINALNSSLYKRAKYKWTFKNYEDWGEALT